MTIESKTSRAERWCAKGALLALCLCLVLPVRGIAADDRVERGVHPLATHGLPPTPEQIRLRWQHVIDHILPLATQRIAADGSFYPFAALLDTEGEISILRLSNPPIEWPKPREALLALVGEARKQAADGRIAATLYVADAMVERRDTRVGQTGVRLKLDDAFGESMEAFVPYIRGEDGSLRLLSPEYRPSRNATYP
jgi:hypothetical protein